MHGAPPGLYYYAEEAITSGEPSSDRVSQPPLDTAGPGGPGPAPTTGTAAPGGAAIDDAPHRITHDAAALAFAIVELHSGITKPVIDIIIMNIRVAKLIGGTHRADGTSKTFLESAYQGTLALATAHATVHLTAWACRQLGSRAARQILRLFDDAVALPPGGHMPQVLASSERPTIKSLGQASAELARREGALRTAYSRLDAAAEEVSFLRGGDRCTVTMDSADATRATSKSRLAMAGDRAAPDGDTSDGASPRHPACYEDGIMLIGPHGPLSVRSSTAFGPLTHAYRSNEGSPMMGPAGGHESQVARSTGLGAPKHAPACPPGHGARRHGPETGALREAFDALMRQSYYLDRMRFAHASVEQYITKYIYTAAGHLISAAGTSDGAGALLSMIPGFRPTVNNPLAAGASARDRLAEEEEQTSERASSLVATRRLLNSSADATARASKAWADSAPKAQGLVNRIGEMLETWDAIEADARQHRDRKPPQSHRSTATGRPAPTPLDPGVQVYARGRMKQSADTIEFHRVTLLPPVMTSGRSPDRPGGAPLLQEISFTIAKGEHLLILGPNGCGKSSLFRVLGGLWPVWGPSRECATCAGTGQHRHRMCTACHGLGALTDAFVSRPSGGVFYVPQRPYLTNGTLLEQIIYPHNEEDMRRRGFDEADVMEILGKMGIQRMVTSRSPEYDGPGAEQPALGLAPAGGASLAPGAVAEDPPEQYRGPDPRGLSGWRVQNSWAAELSVGEQQRLALARLLYHRPAFAVLDECTAALSLGAEAAAYAHARRAGITLISVAHRPSVWAFHNKVLIYDRQLPRGYHFGDFDPVRRERLWQQKCHLENLLREAEKRRTQVADKVVSSG
ncbi:hypothetical protein, variant [Fonticula alba]|nr:hypothetical protein, variant [Fonticula alba]KCV71847.1 hypothetical protein, variant [Fonticula alba]|eukprot:XP_009493424.1 hypothetical protein, variant [Fonticula alba]